MLLQQRKRLKSNFGSPSEMKTPASKDAGVFLFEGKIGDYCAEKNNYRCILDLNYWSYLVLPDVRYANSLGYGCEQIDVVGRV